MRCPVMFIRIKTSSKEDLILFFLFHTFFFIYNLQQ